MILLKRSKATSYKEIGEFLNTHDLADSWNKTKEASFKVDIEFEVTYCAVDKMLSEKESLDKTYIEGSTMFSFIPNEYRRKRGLIC